jgi:site-specific DNA-cytosine methylase
VKLRLQDTFLEILRMLRECGRYRVFAKLLNSRIHSGIPQNRPRVYIVGILISAGVEDFQWPAQAPQRHLEEFLDPHCGNGSDATRSRTTKQSHKRIQKIIQGKEGRDRTSWSQYVGDIQSGFKRPTVMKDCVPCLTKARASGGGHYLFGRRRLTSRMEMFRLMGIPIDRRGRGCR